MSGVVGGSARFGGGALYCTLSCPESAVVSCDHRPRLPRTVGTQELETFAAPHPNANERKCNARKHEGPSDPGPVAGTRRGATATCNFCFDSDPSSRMSSTTASLQGSSLHSPGPTRAFSAEQRVYAFHFIVRCCCAHRCRLRVVQGRGFTAEHYQRAVAVAFSPMPWLLKLRVRFGVRGAHLPKETLTRCRCQRAKSRGGAMDNVNVSPGQRSKF
jgi:hypothetical protein